MPQPEEKVEPFVAVFRDAEEGVLLDELNAHLTEIVAGLHQQHRDHGGKPKAALAVSLVFTLDSKVVEVVAKVKAEMPKPPRGKSIFFRGPDDTLSRQNKQQGELPLRDVSTPEAGPRRVI